MEIILKIFLGLLSIAFGYISYFILKEYNKFKKSDDAEKASLMEKFVLGAITFSCVCFLGVLICFSITLMFSTIIIQLPF